MNFIGKIVYDERTTLQLVKMQQRIFNTPLVITGYIISAFLIATGFYLHVDTTEGLIFLVIGCIFITNIDAPARHRVKLLRTALNGYVPSMDYMFDGNGLTGKTENENCSCNYKELIRIVFDGEFYYLFPNKQSCYMISVDSLKPNNPKEFKKLLENGSGLNVTIPFSFIKHGIYTLISNRFNTRRQ